MKPTYPELLNVVRALVAATSDDERRTVADTARPMLMLKENASSGQTSGTACPFCWVNQHVAWVLEVCAAWLKKPVVHAWQRGKG